MSLSLKVSIVAALLISVPAVVAAQPAAVIRVVGTAVILEEPRGDAEVSGTARPGEILEVLDDRGLWYLVRPPDDSPREWRTGWVSRAMVEPIEVGAARAPGAGSVPQRLQNGHDRVRLELGGVGGASLGLASFADALTDEFALGLRLGGLRNVQMDGGSPLKWLLGGHVGMDIGWNFVVVGEVLMNRLANPSATGTLVGQSVSFGLKTTLSEYTGGVHYLLTRGRSAPYVAAAIGVVRLTAEIGSAELSTPISVSEIDTTWNVGGGMRVLGGSRWGLRPDIRLVRIPDEYFVRASLGLVYQLR